MKICRLTKIAIALLFTISTFLPAQARDEFLRTDGQSSPQYEQELERGQIPRQYKIDNSENGRGGESFNHKNDSQSANLTFTGIRGRGAMKGFGGRQISLVGDSGRTSRPVVKRKRPVAVLKRVNPIVRAERDMEVYQPPVPTKPATRIITPSRESSGMFDGAYGKVGTFVRGSVVTKLGLYPSDLGNAFGRGILGGFSSASDGLSHKLGMLFGRG